MLRQGKVKYIVCICAKKSVSRGWRVSHTVKHFTSPSAVERFTWEEGGVAIHVEVSFFLQNRPIFSTQGMCTLDYLRQKGRSLVPFDQQETILMSIIIFDHCRNNLSGSGGFVSGCVELEEENENK